MSEPTVVWCALCGTQREGDSAHCDICGAAFADPMPPSQVTAGGSVLRGDPGELHRPEPGTDSQATLLAGAGAPWAGSVSPPAAAEPSMEVPAGYIGASSLEAPQAYAASAAAQFAAPPHKSTPKSRGVLIGIGVGAVAVVAAAVGFALLGGDSDTVDVATPVVTATVTAAPAVTEHASVPAVQEEPPATQTVSRDNAASSWPINDTVYGISGEYSRASSLNGVTSRPFAAAVGQAYAATGADGESRSVAAYSPTTGRTYSMWCESQPDTTVLCTGGNDARVLLW